MSTPPTHPRIARYILPTTSLPSRLPLDLLPPSAQTSILRFHKPSDRQLALNSQLLQRYIILHDQQQHQQQPHNFSCTTTTTTTLPSIESLELWRDPESSRPGYLPPPRTNPNNPTVLTDYNVSHHTSLAVLAALYLPHSYSTGLTLPHPLIGVDVVPSSIPTRHHTTPSDFLSSFTCPSAQIFTPHEIHTIMTPITWPRRIKLFYMHWALKEAYVKAIGTGLVTDLTKIEFRNVSMFKTTAQGDQPTDGNTRNPRRNRNCKVQLYLDGQLRQDWYLEIEEYRTDEYGMGGDEDTVEEYYLAIAMKRIPGIDVNVNGEWEELDYIHDILPLKTSK